MQIVGGWEKIKYILYTYKISFFMLVILKYSIHTVCTSEWLLLWYKQILRITPM